MVELASILATGLGVQGIPDAVNLNKYANKKCSLAWHCDNEPIFKLEDGTRIIISLSIGATRAFCFKKFYEAESNALEILLKNGDICVMQGKTQSKWQHCIPEDHSVSGSADDDTRYNLTFRFITQHTGKCCRSGSN
jgi:alkylated DNA repair dioxygenase AlkB